jgi:hypothetical protein
LSPCCLELSKLITIAAAGSFESNALNEQRLEGLQGNVQVAGRALVNLAAMGGTDLRVTQGFRSFAEQDALYAQGRTAPGGDIVTNAQGGQSYHNYGLALDVVEMLDGDANWDADWEALGALGEWIGFEWGGRFTTILDRPHFQMTGGQTIEDLQGN